MDSKDILEMNNVNYGEIQSLTQVYVTDPRSHVPWSPNSHKLPHHTKHYMRFIEDTEDMLL